MRKLCGACVLVHLVVASWSSAVAGVACSPQASGVGGVIADQQDVIAAVNCLGQQLAELRNGANAADKVEAARIEELARALSAVQIALDSLARRVSALEANAANVQAPLATRPW